MTSGKSAHSCSFLNSLDLFQEPHPRVLVLGLQSVLCQLCKEPPPPASCGAAESSRHELRQRSPLLSALWGCFGVTDGRQLHNTTAKLLRWCSLTCLLHSDCLAYGETKALE